MCQQNSKTYEKQIDSLDDKKREVCLINKEIDEASEDGDRVEEAYCNDGG
jgi:hypothetical protein